MISLKVDPKFDKNHKMLCQAAASMLSSAACVTLCAAAQTNLTWLDLSFNKISMIEGLDKLTKMQDLSLFNNKISQIEGLDNLTDLNVLSLGESSSRSAMPSQ